MGQTSLHESGLQRLPEPYKRIVSHAFRWPRIERNRTAYVGPGHQVKRAQKQRSDTRLTLG